MMVHVSNVIDTVCLQVGAPVDLETNKLASDVADISIKESSNATSTGQDGLSNGSNSKEAFVGSLSFTVTNTTSSQPNESSQSAPKFVPSKAKELSSKLPEEKNSTKKPTVRAKVPFEKGYSQMDWLKLTRTHPDLAGSHTEFFVISFKNKMMQFLNLIYVVPGLKGQSNKRLISIDEVRKHKTEGDMWTVLKGRVYNISPYMKFHPGGTAINSISKFTFILYSSYYRFH